MTTRQKLQAEAKKAANSMKSLAEILETISTSEKSTEEIYKALDFAFSFYDALGDALNERFAPLFEERETA